MDFKLVKYPYYILNVIRTIIWETNTNNFLWNNNQGSENIWDQKLENKLKVRQNDGIFEFDYYLKTKIVFRTHKFDIIIDIKQGKIN